MAKLEEIVALYTSFRLPPYINFSYLLNGRQPSHHHWNKGTHTHTCRRKKHKVRKRLTLTEIDRPMLVSQCVIW